MNEDSTYNILHRCIPRRIAVHKPAVEVHHNDTIVLFLKERMCFCNLCGFSKENFCKFQLHSRLSAEHHRERFCSGCIRWKRTNARIWRELLLLRALPAWRCERHETDRSSFQFGSFHKPPSTIYKVHCYGNWNFFIIGLVRLIWHAINKR